MRHVKPLLYYIFGEPLLWLFYWCFQPGRFAREFEKSRAFRRIGPSLRLAVPIFLLSAPLALGTRVAVRALLAIPSPHLLQFIFSIILAVLGGIVLGVVAGIGLELASGVSIALASSLSLSLVVGGIALHSLEAYILDGIAGGLIVTCMLSVAGGKAGNAVISGISAGLVAGLTAGMVTQLVLQVDVSAMILGCMVGMTVGIITSRRKVRPAGGAHPRGRSLIIGAALSSLFIIPTPPAGVFFALTFLLIFYRLPLYAVSSFSSWKALLASRKQPSHVFTYLHASALYWDEAVYLPLPGLKRLLTIAAEQNIGRALEEVMFMVMERPLQIEAARFVALKIALHDLEMRDTLRAIAGASTRLSEIFPHGTGLIDPQWSMILVHLHDASQNAAQACSPVGWQARHNALEAMLADLKHIHPHTAFNDIDLNTCLADLIARWQEAAERELQALEQAPEKTRRVSNPYNPGPALERSNKLFVGRYDLASQLGEALARKDHRPTFLLYGERRMGKSSVLKHLPDLLGARFLPVFYDLQSPDSTASIAALLSMVAEEIVLALEARGLKAKKIAYERLQGARRENEAAVYYVFSRWLRGIEQMLEREDRTLLLLFDEYEKLDRAGMERYLQLELLLNWFRSIMQHHPRLALLFSGVQIFGDMGINWAGYFVNVQTLKVSFLQPAEAYQLITQPIQSVPVEQIFAPGVIEEILRVTGCHPFLVQALSSALIDALNSRRRNQVEMQDVGKAVNAVFKNWGSTYFRDLWERTTPAQRACLSALKVPGSADLLTITQRTGLDRQTIHQALAVLVDRDLVSTNEQGMYRLAAPLFREWVGRNDSAVPMMAT